LHVWIARVLETEGFADTVEQHVRVAAAIEAGDPDAAERAMRAHMSSAGERLLSSLPKLTNQ
jgi:GntR family transcriptional regulator, transcriptional repressor for pyruvate dehydrogenase complex